MFNNKWSAFLVEVLNSLMVSCRKKLAKLIPLWLFLKFIPPQCLHLIDFLGYLFVYQIAFQDGLFFQKQ